jgi:hypothetical protein
VEWVIEDGICVLLPAYCSLKGSTFVLLKKLGTVHFLWLFSKLVCRREKIIIMRTCGHVAMQRNLSDPVSLSTIHDDSVLPLRRSSTRKENVEAT